MPEHSERSSLNGRLLHLRLTDRDLFRQQNCKVKAKDYTKE